MTDAEEKKLDEECLTTPLDTHARELAAKADYALKMMHRGAALHRCDWAIGFDDGITTQLPHTQAARALSAFACLQARIRFEDARRAVAEGLSELRIAADSPTRRARAAHAMLVKVEPAASALEDVLRQVVTTLADTPPSATPPPAAVSPSATDAGVP